MICFCIFFLSLHLILYFTMLENGMCIINWTVCCAHTIKFCSDLFVTSAFILKVHLISPIHSCCQKGLKVYFQHQMTSRYSFILHLSHYFYTGVSLQFSTGKARLWPAEEKALLLIPGPFQEAKANPSWEDRNRKINEEAPKEVYVQRGVGETSKTALEISAHVLSLRC